MINNNQLMRSNFLLAFLFFFFVVHASFAQDEKRTATVIGTIYTETGETLPFATVLLEGTDIATGAQKDYQIQVVRGILVATES